MTAAFLQEPGLDTRARLHVARTDITFATVSPEWVEIEVTVTNRGEGCSQPTAALLRAAPLGAFVPWRPLGVFPVPALEPGEAYVLRTRALRPAPAPLGPPDRVPPRRLLTAFGLGDDRPDPSTARGALPVRGLPADLMDFLGRTNPHWAGNLNVFVGGRPVERHLAQALRVYPGRVNMALFFVGSGKDAYRFKLAGTAAAWDARLYDTQGGKALTLEPETQAPIATDDWVPMDRPRILMLALQPPKGCTQGRVEVHVTQHSTGQRAVVEFSLDPSAAGPGCYVV